MSLEQYLWIGAGLLLIVVIAVLDTLRRKRIADAEARMTPEEREISRREAKVFRSALRRGR